MIEFQSNETVLVSARKHWLIFALESAGLGLGVILPIGIIIITRISAPDFIQYTLGTQVFYQTAIFITAAWWLVMFIIFAAMFTNYYLDIFIITNQRVIDIEQLGLFARDVTSAPLQNIEDIKVEIIGILPSLLDFGNLHIQTAAAMREITIYGIHRPNKIRDLIIAAHAKTIPRALNTS
ncbi:MAG: PH domain-containing protein [Patescibacteria group bacterium]